MLVPCSYLLNYVKSVQIRSYSWSVFSCIRTEFWKIPIRNISVFGHFSRSAKTITYSLLENKRCIDIYEHKKLTKLKKIHLLRTNIPIGILNFKWKYLNTQNIWACLWNMHNSVNLVLSFLCECDQLQLQRST